MTPRQASMARRGAQGGFTLVELLLGILLMAVFGAALYGFLQNGMTQSATEQSRATMQMQARDSLARLARDVRQASKPDSTNPGIEQITATSMVLYVDNTLVDASAPYTLRPWRVRYRIDGTQLVREVVKPVGTAPPYTYGAYTGTEVMVNGIANTSSTPLFAAFTSEGAALPATVVSPDNLRIGRVRLRLLIKYANGNSSPTAEFTTDVAPRNPAN